MDQSRMFRSFAAAVVAAAFLTPVSAQSPVAATSFDVASIRQNTASSDGRHHIYNDPAESHFRAVNLSVRSLLQYAYGLPENQILGGPSWIDSTMFDIDAKSDAAVDAQLHALPSDQARQQKQLMTQALLADRFQFMSHRETRELPVFDLVLAKGGPKFKPSEKSGTTIDSGNMRIHVQGSDNTIELLARVLGQALGRVVVDKTGIDARYDLTLRWTPDNVPAPMLNGAPDPNPPPDIFTAIQEQLGLKLEPAKGSVPVLVIDHVEMPSEN